MTKGRSATHRPRLTVDQLERARRLSAIHPRIVVAELMGTTPHTLVRAEKRGWKPAGNSRRPVPSDWGIIAPGRTSPWLAKHYHASQTTITRWRREKPVELTYNGGQPWEPPANFAQLLEQHPAKHVALMLGKHEATVMRARYRLGIHPKQVAARRSLGWADRYVTTSQGASA